MMLREVAEHRAVGVDIEPLLLDSAGVLKWPHRYPRKRQVRMTHSCRKS